MESDDTIKLAKDESGQHHFIPLSWVTFVDDKVHVDRLGDQVMREWSMTPPSTLEPARYERPTGQVGPWIHGRSRSTAMNQAIGATVAIRPSSSGPNA